MDTIFSDQPKRRKAPPAEELYFTEVLDSICPDNPNVSILVPTPKSKWVLAFLQGMISRSWRESILFFEKDDPLFATSPWAHIALHSKPVAGKPYLKNIVATQTNEPQHTTTALIVKAIAFGYIAVKYNTTEEAERMSAAIRRKAIKLRTTDKYAELRPYYVRTNTYIEETTLYIMCPNPIKAP